MNCISVSATPDEARWKHRHSSLMNKKRTLLSHPHVWSGDTTTWSNQQASGIDHSPTILAPLLTPPQVSTSTCNNARRKFRTNIVGRQRGRVYSSLFIPGSPTLSLSKKIIAGSFPRFVAYDDKRDGIPLRVFYRTMMDSVHVCITTSFVSPDLFLFKRVLSLLCRRNTHIQMCICPANRKWEIGDRRTIDHIICYMLDQLISEAQEKNGKRPQPAKPKKPKQERPGREGGKGKSKGKSPRTEELVPSIM